MGNSSYFVATASPRIFPLTNQTMLRIIFFSVLLQTSCLCSAQTDEPDERSLEEKYNWRIKQESLYGTYIPKDVNEAIMVLTKLTDAESKEKFKSMSEEEACQKLFFSLGRWMSYNWSFYEGSRLSVHLQKSGIHHPDNMTRFLMIVYHRSLSNKSLEIEGLVKAFTQKEEKEKEEKLKSGTVLYQERRKLPKQPSGND